MRLLALVAALALAGCASPSALTPSTTQDPARGPLCADPCVVAIDEGDGGAFEPMVAVDPRDPDHRVVAASEHGLDGSRWNYAYVTTDGGASWTRARLPGGPAAGASHPLFGAKDMADPVAAIHPDGSVILIGVAYGTVEFLATTGFSLYAARSDDGGRTFGEVRIVDHGRGGGAGVGPASTGIGMRANDKPWMAIGPDGTVMVTWSRIDRAGPLGADVTLMFSTSSDSGRSWTSPRPIAPPGPEVSGPFPAMSAAWGAHAVYQIFDEPRSIGLASSRDGGTSWDTRIVAKRVANSYPSILSVPTSSGKERLVVSYCEAVGEDQEAVVLIFSDDGGATWSEPLAVDEPGGAIWSQPSLAAASGTLYVGYYWARDASGPVEFRQVTITAGVPSAPVVLETGLEGPTGYRGHYTGTAAVPGGAFSVWVGGQGPRFGASSLDLHGATTMRG